MVTGMKQTEIGLIPEDWEVKKLGSIAFITKLAGFEYSKHFNSYKDGGEIIVVRGTNITNNKLDLTDTKIKTETDFTMDNPCYGIVVTAPNLENAVAFIRYAFDL